MGRINRKPVFKIRYKKPGKILGGRLTQSRNGGKKLKGRVLSVRKVPTEQILGIREFSLFNPEKLLAEFGEKEKGGRV